MDYRKAVLIFGLAALIGASLIASGGCDGGTRRPPDKPIPQMPEGMKSTPPPNAK